VKRLVAILAALTAAVLLWRGLEAAGVSSALRPARASAFLLGLLCLSAGQWLAWRSARCVAGTFPALERTIDRISLAAVALTGVAAATAVFLE
jgi:hypothetical protein